MKAIVVFILLAFSLGAKAENSAEATPKPPTSLASLKSAVVGAEPIRVKIVRDAAMSAAMRAGLARQSVHINKMLDRQARFLDDIYDFSGFMLENNVVPPVIRRVDNIAEHDGDVLRYSAVRFKIVNQATFATRAPTWRTYLKIPVWNDSGIVHGDLMPKTSAEHEAAREGLKKGWDAGVKQANDMFFKGLNKLDNDFLGMATYHALLKSNMVTLPKILRRDVPVVGDGSSMTLDQSTYTIEVKPVFNPQMMSWLALIDGNPESSLFANSINAKEADRVKSEFSSLADLQKAWNVN